MAQLVVRNLEEDVKTRLQHRASRHGHSMEEEVRDILRNAVKHESLTAMPLGSRIRSRFARTGLDEDIPELRGPILTSNWSIPGRIARNPVDTVPLRR